MSREIMTYSTYQDKKGNTLMIQCVGETFIAVKVYRQNLRVRRMGSINICETAQECQEKLDAFADSHEMKYSGTLGVDEIDW